MTGFMMQAQASLEALSKQIWKRTQELQSQLTTLNMTVEQQHNQLATLKQTVVEQQKQLEKQEQNLAKQEDDM